MDEERRRTLLDEASERYNEGEYEQAISLWNEVIAMDPGNRKAQEGIRMARLLVADGASESPGSFAGPDGAPAGSDPASATSADVGERIAAGIRRVRDLAARGELAEALEGCALLSEISPRSEEIAGLEAEIRSLAGPTSAGSPSVGAVDDTAPHILTGPGSGPGDGDLDAALLQAREALAEGRNRDAAEAASRALQIDPSSMEACGILSLAADDQASTAPLSIGHDVPFGASSEAFG
ncbi:MAG TPA: hypothetical protein VFP98_03780, partial [Candidatus Polarisedimenticolia bacterium]|nr:hypothetical protein [Candidatus Polarisedimenticolia bacterium]